MGGLKKLPKSDNGKVVKIVKIHIHLVVVVVGFQFQLTYLKNWLEMKLCELIENLNH